MVIPIAIRKVRKPVRKVARKPVITQAKFDAAIDRIMAAGSNIPETADRIAILLYNEGVRKARCGNATKCALAQHLANIAGRGFTVSVTASTATVRGGSFIRAFSLPHVVGQFVHAFDDKEYRFLM